MTRIVVGGQEIGGFWTYPKVDIDRQVKVTLLIRVGIVGATVRDLSVQSINAEFVTPDGRSIPPSLRPDGPLVPFGGPSIHVNATFTFPDLPTGTKTLRVWIRDASATYVLTDTIAHASDEFRNPPRYGDRFPPSHRWWHRITDIITDIIGLFRRRCCVHTFGVPTNRNPINNAMKMTEIFDMNATFSDVRQCRCRCCEYRQFVRGQFTEAGVRQDHDLAYAALDVDLFREDGIADYWGPGRPIRYGHRGDPEFNNDRYIPKRVDGCEYRGHDEPGWHGKAPGRAYTVDLEFWGAIIDVCRRRVVRSASWRVRLPEVI